MYKVEYKPFPGYIKKGEKFWMKDIKGNDRLYTRVEPHPEWAVLEADDKHLSASLDSSPKLVMTVDIRECTRVELSIDTAHGPKPISKAAKWLKDGDEIEEDSVKLIWAVEVVKKYRNGETSHLLMFDHKPEDWEVRDAALHWAEHDDMSGHNYGYKLNWEEGSSFVHHVEVLGQCGHFH